MHITIKTLIFRIACDRRASATGRGQPANSRPDSRKRSHGWCDDVSEAGWLVPRDVIPVDFVAAVTEIAVYIYAISVNL